MGNPTEQAVKILTFETKFHRFVQDRHRFELDDAPDWAVARARESSVWMLRLDCGHVVGPIVGTPPVRMHCSECSGGRGHGYRRRRG